mgnify:CR=1 FL=1
MKSIYLRIVNGSISCPFSKDSEKKNEKRTGSKYISCTKIGRLDDNDLQAELERKFDELFGPVDDTEDKITSLDDFWGICDYITIHTPKTKEIEIKKSDFLNYFDLVK